MRCFQESYFKNCANPTEKWRKSCLHLFQLTAEQILGGGQIKRATTKLQDANTLSARTLHWSLNPNHLNLKLKLALTRSLNFR